LINSKLLGKVFQKVIEGKFVRGNPGQRRAVYSQGTKQTVPCQGLIRSLSLKFLIFHGGWEVIMRKNILLSLRIFMLAVLFTSNISNAAEYSTDGPLQAQAAKRLSCDPIEFSPPDGYWYYPPLLYADKGNFLFTFYKTKKEALEAPEGMTNPIINVRVFPNTFKNANAYYQALSEKEHVRSAEETSYTRKLPKDTELFLKGKKNWSCKEEVKKGYPDLIGIECILLNRNGVLITVLGSNEKKILNMAPTLVPIMNSITFNSK
jgi:hypothetical protein